MQRSQSLSKVVKLYCKNAHNCMGNFVLVTIIAIEIEVNILNKEVFQSQLLHFINLASEI